jgi:hypothetical protein
LPHTHTIFDQVLTVGARLIEVDKFLDNIVAAAPNLRYLSTLHNAACPFFSSAKHHYYNYRHVDKPSFIIPPSPNAEKECLTCRVVVVQDLHTESPAQAYSPRQLSCYHGGVAACRVYHAEYVVAFSTSLAGASLAHPSFFFFVGGEAAPPNSGIEEFNLVDDDDL